MNKIVWIGAAGAAGAMSRVWLGQAMNAIDPFFMATFIANMTGSFLISLLAAGFFKKLMERKDLYDAVTVGFLGSFTTFSALSTETIELITDERMILAVLYVTISFMGGMTAIWAGYRIGTKRRALHGLD